MFENFRTFTVVSICMLLIVKELNWSTEEYMHYPFGLNNETCKSQYNRPSAKSAYQNYNFLVSQPKHMLWVQYSKEPSQ